MSAVVADVVAVRVPERTWRSEARAVKTVWRRDLIRFAGNRAQVMMWLVQPLLFLFVLGSGLQSLSAASTGGVDLKTFIFPGVLCMGALFTGIFSAASLVWDRELGFLREMLVAPVSRSASHFGKCLGGATVASAQGAILLAPVPLGELARPVVELGVADLAVLGLLGRPQLLETGLLAPLDLPAPAQRHADRERHQRGQHQKRGHVLHALAQARVSSRPRRAL